MCEECLEEEERDFTHTRDGRRFATPICSTKTQHSVQLESVADNSDNVESDPAWNNALHDGIEPCVRRSNAQYVLREIDLRGVGIQQQKLGYRKAQVKEFPQFVKSATSASVMCGGGGGCGGDNVEGNKNEKEI